MAYAIQCEQFKTESFNNGDSETWNQKIIECDEIEKTITVEGCKDLLYALAQRGEAYTVVGERVYEVVEALAKHGYTAEFQVV